MTLFCYTCRKSMELKDDNIIYDNGSDMAVYRCTTCGTRYLAVADERFPQPILFKLTLTKSSILGERSRILAPTAANIIIPGRK